MVDVINSMKNYDDVQYLVKIYGQNADNLSMLHGVYDNILSKLPSDFRDLLTRVTQQRNMDGGTHFPRPSLRVLR